MDFNNKTKKGTFEAPKPKEIKLIKMLVCPACGKELRENGYKAHGSYALNGIDSTNYDIHKTYLLDYEKK